MKTTKEYSSPTHKLIKFFKESRDRWKSKYQQWSSPEKLDSGSLVLDLPSTRIHRLAFSEITTAGSC
jgi:hypothetical protein